MIVATIKGKEGIKMYTKGEWKWQFDPLDPNGKIEVTQSGGVIFTTQTLKNAERLCQILNSYSDMYEALKNLLAETDLLVVEECDHDVGICWCSYKNARFQAAHALAKAEGKGS